MLVIENLHAEIDGPNTLAFASHERAGAELIVASKYPMEFAVEAQKLLGISLEGSVG